MKKILFFFVVLALAINVNAAVPDVDFNWYVSGMKDINTNVFQSIIFNPNIVSTQDINSMMWRFDSDGNVNYFNYFLSSFFDTFTGTNGTVITTYNPNYARTTTGPSTTMTIQSNAFQLDAFNDGSSGGDTIRLNNYDLNKWDSNQEISFKIKSIAGNVDTARLGLGKQSDNITPVAYIDFGTGTTAVSCIGAGSGSTSFSANDIFKFSLGKTGTNTFNISCFKNDVIFSTANTNFGVESFKFMEQISSAGGTVTVVLDDLNLGNPIDFLDANINRDLNQNHTFSSVGIKNVCLTAGNNDGNFTHCRLLSVIEPIEVPKIIVFDKNITTGFGISDLNSFLVLQCDSNLSQVDYQVYLNGVLVYDQNNAPNTKVYSPISISNGTNNIIFTCRVSATVSSSETKIVKVYRIGFRVVNEKTGVPLSTYADFNLLRLTMDINNFFNFNAANGNYVMVSSLNPETLRLDVNYITIPPIETFKNFNLEVISPDENIDICVAQPYVNLSEQKFISSQKDAVIMRHTISNCYSIADYTKYSYNNLLSNNTATLNASYYLYYFDGSIRVLLTNIDGSAALIHNLQTLRLNRTDFNILITTDTVAVSPLYDPLTKNNVPNVLQIFYRSLESNNISLNLKIFNGATLLNEFTETINPNEIIWDWNYSTFGLLDSNMLRLVVTKTNATGKIDTFNHYFNISGVDYSGTLNPSIAILLGAVVLIFGMTIVSRQFAFGWWGVLIGLLAIGLVALAPGVWWLNVFMATCIVILLFNVLVYKNEASRVV